MARMRSPAGLLQNADQERQVFGKTVPAALRVVRKIRMVGYKDQPGSVRGVVVVGRHVHRTRPLPKITLVRDSFKCETMPTIIIAVLFVFAVVVWCRPPR